MTVDNFIFVDEFVAGSALPTKLEDLEFYEKQGITDIISLTESRPDILKNKGSIPLRETHLPVSTLPTEELITNFLDKIKEVKESGGKVVVHCELGQERTGIMLVIYLVDQCGMDVRKAISAVRKESRSALRTYASNDFLRSRYKL